MSGAPDFDPTPFEGVDRAVVGVDGLWCPSCAAAVGRAIETVPGITRARVSFASASAALAWTPGADLGRVARKVAAMGYRLTAPARAEDLDAHVGAEMSHVAKRLAVAVTFGMWTMMLSVLLYLNPEGIAEGKTGRALALAAGAAALPVIAVAGLPILRAGWRTARAGVPGMDSLVGLGVLGAVSASAWSLAQGGAHVWFDTSVMLIVLLTVGRLIEMGTLRRSARAIAALRSALPETARRRDPEGTLREVLAAELPVGAEIRVGAGERVPLDGCIVRGESRFDTSVLSGEAAPRRLGQGNEVLAGFVNLTGPVDVTVSAPVGRRRIDLIGADIAASLHDRPEMDRLADRLARAIVPVALGLALLALGWGLLIGQSAEAAGLRALSVLVIACPCAVALAAPVTHLAAAGAAARAGIHFRTQGAAESLGGARRVFFDKTGTLTVGRPRVRRVETRAGLTDARALALAAAAERDVAHPVAEALRRAGGDGPAPSRIERAEDGVEAVIDGADVLVGSRRFLEARGIALPEPACGAADTEVLLALEGAWAATFHLGDTLRRDAAETIAWLRAAGLAPGMISGDGPAPCARIGAAVGLGPEEIHAACAPEDKAALIKAAGPAGTVFVGDGVNDLPAIARAGSGIAATDASPATIAIADVVIARGGVGAVVHAIGISRRARRILRQNLAFSVLYNVLALGFAAFGTVPPLAAAIAMTASSLMVIGNAARLGGLSGIALPGAAPEPDQALRPV